MLQGCRGFVKGLTWFCCVGGKSSQLLVLALRLEIDNNGFFTLITTFKLKDTCKIILKVKEC